MLLGLDPLPVPDLPQALMGVILVAQGVER